LAALTQDRPGVARARPEADEIGPATELRSEAWPRIPTVLALAALAVAGLAAIAVPGTLVVVVAAAVAAALLGRLPALGPLPAAFAVVLAIPVGRGADVLAFEIAGLPLRPADAAIAVGLLGVLPHLRLPARGDRTVLALLGLFLATGIVALFVGLLADHALRDVFRDVRWWALYAVLGVALLARLTPASILRALDVGAGAFAVVAIATVVLPFIEGGLKDHALFYDRGTLRMQYANSVFLLPAIARVLDALMRRGGLLAAGWLLLLITALVLSLTRTSLLVMAVMAVMVVGVTVLAALIARDGRIRVTLLRAALAGGTTVAALVLGLGLAVAGVAVTGPPETTETGAPARPAGESPLDRVTFQSEDSNLESTVAAANGRMTTYRNALAVILDTPVLGAGMGSLVDVPFAYNQTRAHTIGKQPGVDNAYLTVGLKAGAIGVLMFAGLMLLPLLYAVRVPGLRRWFVPAWLAIGVLTMTQSFAVSNYGPFALGLLIAVPVLGYAATRGATARSHV